MKFKDKDGNVFADEEKAIEEFCPNKRGITSLPCRSCPIRSLNNQSGLPCETYVSQYPAEAARLMGYEVIEDEPGADASETTPLPSICSILGIEIGKPFAVRGYPGRDYPHLIYDGEDIRAYAPGGGKGHRVSTRALLWMIEHPEAVQPVRRITDQDVEDATAILRIFPAATEDTTVWKYAAGAAWIGERGAWDARLRRGLFPGMQPGETATLGEILGGASRT